MASAMARCSHSTIMQGATSLRRSAPSICRPALQAAGARFPQLQARCPLKNRLTRGRNTASVVVASSDVKMESIDSSNGVPGGEYTPLFALAAFAAAYFQQVNINVPFLLRALAYYAIVKAAALVVFREGLADHVSTVLAPAALAVNALNIAHLDLYTVVIGVLGFHIAQGLEGLPFWGWVATLVASIYFNYGTWWIVLAYAFGALTRLLNGLENDKISPTSIPVLAISAFAVYYEYKTLWTVCLALGEVARSFYFLLAHSVNDSEPKGLPT